jgi:hypothetical protein
VLYSDRSTGNELRIATIDTQSGRLVGTSPNLARKAVSAARVAHRARGGNTPTNLVIGRLSTTGRSVEVEVFWPRNAGLSTDMATTYRVQLDDHGLPTGSVSAVGSRYLR